MHPLLARFRTVAIAEGWSFLVLLFVAMLGLAASNRYRLTPALARALEVPSAAQGAALVALRGSVIAETVLGVCVLALVAYAMSDRPPSTSKMRLPRLGGAAATSTN